MGNKRLLRSWLALEEKYKEDEQKEIEGYERIKQKESDKLPKPTGWRILVLPFKMPEKTKGGLFLGQETLERQQVAFNFFFFVFFIFFF